MELSPAAAVTSIKQWWTLETRVEVAGVDSGDQWQWWTEETQVTVTAGL